MSITGTSGTRAIRSSYPFTSGLIAETTSQTGHQENLIPEVGSNVPDKEREGL